MKSILLLNRNLNKLAPSILFFHCEFEMKQKREPLNVEHSKVQKGLFVRCKHRCGKLPYS